VLLCACWAGYPQTAQERVARFAALFGVGKYARVVWQREGINNRKPNFDIVYGGSEILAMDTKDGAVRTLKPNTSNKHWSGATFTWDGQRVIYYDNVGLAIRIVNWDGTGDQVLLSNFEGEGRCWQSSDGKNWVLATEFKNNANGARLYRVNIANTAERVELFNCATWARVGYAGSTCWATTSKDGKYVVGGFPNYGDIGFFQVKTPVPTTVTKLDPNGCWPSISPDNQYHILYTDDGNLAHKQLYIVDINQNVVLQKGLLAGGVFTSSTEAFESLRYTSDPDYVALFSAPYADCCAYDATGTTNPKIIRLSNLAWAGVDDNCETPEGDCDVWFYGSTAAGTAPAAPAARMVGRGISGGRMFDIRGRTTTRDRSPGLRLAAADGDARIFPLPFPQ
jgi:hypothetical protein